MELFLRLFSMIVGAIMFLAVFKVLINKKLNESNSIMWFVIAFITLIAGLFPDIITWLANLIQVDYPPALLFLVSILVMLLILFKHSSELSTMNTRIKEIAMILSLVKEENKELKEQLQRMEDNTNKV